MFWGDTAWLLSKLYSPPLSIFDLSRTSTDFGVGFGVGCLLLWGAVCCAEIVAALGASDFFPEPLDFSFCCFGLLSHESFRTFRFGFMGDKARPIPLDLLSLLDDFCLGFGAGDFPGSLLSLCCLTG